MKHFEDWKSLIQSLYEAFAFLMVPMISIEQEDYLLKSNS